MPANTSKTTPVPAAIVVGARVRVRRGSGEAQAGEVVEDYAALTDSQRGHEWAPAR